MKVKKRKKIAYQTSREAVGPQAGENDGAVALQAGQNEQAKSVTQAEAGTQTEQELAELVESEKEQEVAAKVFCLDEENEESDSVGNDSGWEDNDDNEDYFSD